MGPLAKKVNKLFSILSDMGPRVIALSGGLDSLLLSVFSSRFFPKETFMVHAVSPAVPLEAARRVRAYARKGRWKLKAIDSGEMSDKKYLRNPKNRCYYCKKHLYSILSDKAFIKKAFGIQGRYSILSGANTDDLGEYRPGLSAASESAVRHPFIEAGIGKKDVRQIARAMHLPFSELAASPCLASRIYTGTPVTGGLLRLVDDLEMYLRNKTKISVLRCRIRGRSLLVEVGVKDRKKISARHLEGLNSRMTKYTEASFIKEVLLDPKPYRSGRAFVGKA